MEVVRFRTGAGRVNYKILSFLWYDSSFQLFWSRSREFMFWSIALQWKCELKLFTFNLVSRFFSFFFFPPLSLFLALVRRETGRGVGSGEGERREVLEKRLLLLFANITECWIVVKLNQSRHTFFWLGTWYGRVFWDGDVLNATHWTRRSSAHTDF